MDSDAIIGAVTGVTKKWTKQRKAEERSKSAEANRRVRMTVRYRETIKDVAYDCMEEAYLKASGGGRLPASARQIMYKARPTIQDVTGQKLSDQYFCQTLLPDYMADFGVNWDVVFDDRGHFQEPHTDCVVGLGTLGVRKYLAGVKHPSFTELKVATPKFDTQGPAGRFGAIMFIEKEGFMPLFEEVRLAERYDLAIMSTKGVSNTAARKLVDDICGRHDIPLLVLHDFDKAGFSILGTLERSTRRYTFHHDLNVIDLGLRLADVQELGLDSESAYDRGSTWSRRENLRTNGATDEEIEFLLSERVELNALASDDLIEWIESKLQEHGVAKVMPDDDFLETAFRHSVSAAYAVEQAEELLNKAEQKGAEAVVPADLRDQVAKLIEDDEALSWDEAVKEIAEGQIEVDEDGQ